MRRVRRLRRYAEDGFGLWAVTLQDSDVMAGQCGLTRQRILGADVVEVGSLFNRASRDQGYAVEAASTAV